MPSHSVSENILILICSLGILQGIILAAIIYFHPKSDRSVNIFLSFFILFVSSVSALPLFIFVFGWQRSYLWIALPMLPGPLIYFYLRSFKESITWKKFLPHLIPFFLFMFLSYLNIMALSRKYPDGSVIPTGALTNPMTTIFQFIRVSQMVIYYFMARKVLFKYQRSIQQLFSETSHFDLGWARLLLNGYLILVFAFPFIFPLMLIFPEKFSLWLLINVSLGTPYIYAATFKGISQPTIWQLKPNMNEKELKEEIVEVEEIENPVEAAEDDKPIKPLLSSDRIGEINGKILALMEGEKIYQEPELTLQQLANKLDCPTYQVSQAINEGMKKNFYDLVNGYRVEEAKRLLLNPRNRNFTILSIGFEAGFNSKTTFNTVFKKFTGTTPTEFRDREREPALSD